MVGLDLAQPCFADLLVGRQRIDAEDDAGLALDDTQRRCPRTLEARAAQSEDARDLDEVLGFRRIDVAVGPRDIEQTFEQLLEDLGRIGEQRRDLSGIGLEARRVALGEVEEAFDVALLARRHAEEAAEGFDLFFLHLAIDAGHLGAERDHADGEGHLAQAGMLATLCSRWRGQSQQGRK